MRPNLPGIAAGVLLVAGGAVALLWPRGGPAPDPAETLEPLAESPRPPVSAERAEPYLRAPSPALARPRGPAPPRGRLLEARNARAREHRDAVARYEAGATSIREVEEAEMRLLDARHDLGELDGRAWHRARAVLFERDAERAQILFDAGVTPIQPVEHARLALELERRLAGDPDAYAEKRERFLADTKARHRTLAEAGFEAPKALEEEYARLEEEFPPADALPAAGER